MCVNGWESEYPFSVNSYESEYPKTDESGNIYESGKISSSVNLVLISSTIVLHVRYNSWYISLAVLTPGPYLI